MWTVWRFSLLIFGVLLVNLQLAVRRGELALPVSGAESLRYLVERSAPGLAAVALLALVTAIPMWTRYREGFLSIIGLSEGREVTLAASSNSVCNIVGWLFLIGGFIGLECLEPYYFTQDDALVGELPGVLLGCRSLWDGVFPDWNPYVFLGSPLASIGFWAITYPPQLLAYAVARHILGNELATLEVFAALHLVAGFVAMRYLVRRLGMGAMLANLAALSYVYAGCIVIMGRSWQPFIANAVWLPLVGIAIERFRQGPVGWKWIGGTGLVVGLSYHAGFPQITAILGMFLVIGVVAVAYADSVPLRRLAAIVPALLLGAGLAAPLLLHNLQMTGTLERFVPQENGVYDHLSGAILPYPLAEAELPTGWGTFHVEKLGHFYFFGGLFALLFAVQAYCFLIYFPERTAWARCWWVPCGILAFLMVMGEPAYLWKSLAPLPLSKFFLRYSFRYYPLFAFCSILSGGVILERAWGRFPTGPCVSRLQTGSTIMELCLGGALLGVLTYHLAMCQASFYSYGFRPYPELPPAFEAVFHPLGDKQLVGPYNSRRMASWTQLRSVSPDYYLGLPLNLPHYYQVPSIFGYDPVIEGQPRMIEVYRRLESDPVAASKAYGVGWHLFSYGDARVLSVNPRFWSMETAVNREPAYRHLLTAGLNFLAESHGTKLMELPGAEPLAFVTGQPERPLPMRLHCRGADIDVAGLAPGTRVTINFLWYPQMSCTLNGKALPAAADDWQRITTLLPESGQVLALRFEPPWDKTCIAGAAMCLAALGLGRLTREREQHP